MGEKDIKSDASKSAATREESLRAAFYDDDVDVEEEGRVGTTEEILLVPRSRGRKNSKHRFELNKQQKSRGRILVALLVVAVLLGTGVYLLLWVIDTKSEHPWLPSSAPSPESPDSPPSSGTAPQLEIVISAYETSPGSLKAQLDSIKAHPNVGSRNLVVTVYHKDPNLDESSYLQESGVDRVIRLPNVGREGETYLHHMSDRYDSLAEYTLFMQETGHDLGDGGPLPHWANDRLDVFQDRSFISLAHTSWLFTMNCLRHDYVYTPDVMRRIPQVFALATGRICPGDIVVIDGVIDLALSKFSAKGQFIVHRDQVRKQPVRLYQYLDSVISADQSNFVHIGSAQDGNPSQPSNPYFGHVIERSYHMLFDCWDKASPRCRDGCISCVK
ncbi:hypothetical protein HKX48_003522 [Thoreauomyces humboldtii]|nr:hypothetical protein HKX48_003522 [Thoreauomyces humboldtii]